MAGVIAMDTSCAGETVRVVDPVTEPDVADIVVSPTAALVATPAAEIEATAPADELQVTAEVRSWVLPSLNVPVAMNCWVVPRAIELFAGVIAIDWSTAGSTVNDAGFEVIDPCRSNDVCRSVSPLWARPAALMVATDGAADVQVTRPVTFWVEPPVKVPVAANCCVVPSGIDALAGVTDRPSSAAGVTVSVVCPDTPPEEAVIVVMPTSFAVPILIPEGHSLLCRESTRSKLQLWLGSVCCHQSIFRLPQTAASYAMASRHWTG